MERQKTTTGQESGVRSAEKERLATLAMQSELKGHIKSAARRTQKAAGQNQRRIDDSHNSPARSSGGRSGR